MNPTSLLFAARFPLSFGAASEFGHCHRCERDTTWVDQIVAYSCQECGNDPVSDSELLPDLSFRAMNRKAARHLPANRSGRNPARKLISFVRDRIGSMGGALRPAA